jgi:hypothetical protein
MPDNAEVKYLVLADRAVPYLLARVRWPDVCQAISAASPDWLDDPGLFDLPYAPSAVTVSFSQAASVAAGWGRRLHAEPVEGAPSYLRRMPANWSDLSLSEQRTWGIEFVGRRHAPALRLRRLRSLQAKIAGSSAAAQVNGQIDASAAGERTQPADVTNGTGSVAPERRGHVRAPLDGRAHIRCQDTTISAGLVDLGERGLQCVLPEPSPLVARGATLGGAFVLEAEADTSRLCLDVAGRISWRRRTRAGTHFGVAFGELDEGETEGVQRFLAAAGTRRGHR